MAQYQKEEQEDKEKWFDPGHHQVSTEAAPILEWGWWYHTYTQQFQGLCSTKSPIEKAFYFYCELLLTHCDNKWTNENFKSMANTLLKLSIKHRSWNCEEWWSDIFYCFVRWSCEKSNAINIRWNNLYTVSALIRGVKID